MSSLGSKVKLGSVARMTSGGTPPSGVSRYYGGGVPWVSISDMTSSGKYVTRTEVTLSQDGLAASAAKLYDPNVVLYAMYASLGECSIARGQVSSSQAILGISPGPRLDREYLYYFLQFIKLTVRLMGQQGTQSNLNAGMVRDFIVPLPTVAKQQAIAKSIAEVDSLIESIQRLITKKRAIKQGMMQELLTGRTRLPGFDENLSKIQLGDVATFSKGAGLPKSLVATVGDFQCVHYGELFLQYAPVAEHTISRTDWNGHAKSQSGDVLMPTSDVTPKGLAKATALLSSGVVLGGDILVIRADKRHLDSAYLAYAIRNDAKQVLNMVRGSTVYHLYARDMRRFELAVPSLQEQQMIARILHDADTEISALERRLEATRDIKQGMMQELLTGRTRLPIGEEVAV